MDVERVEMSFGVGFDWPGELTEKESKELAALIMDAANKVIDKAVEDQKLKVKLAVVPNDPAVN